MSEDAFWKGPREFAATRWSLVARARGAESAERDRALNQLCEAYWYPLYAFIRRKGHEAESAKDLVQDFLSRWLQGPALERADASRGKFRTFLLAALNDFLVDQHRRDHAQKRGGAVSHVALDGLELEQRYKLEPISTASPEALYDKHWAEALLQRAKARLREEGLQSGRPEFFAALEPHLLSDMADGEAERLGERFGMMRGAVSAALFRLRKKLRKCVEAEVIETLADESELPEEMAHLFATLFSHQS
jgi:RNA polymerase sigma factor (sigma-70 family)